MEGSDDLVEFTNKLQLVTRMIQKQMKYLEDYVKNNQDILVDLVDRIYSIKSGETGEVDQSIRSNDTPV